MKRGLLSIFLMVCAVVGGCKKHAETIPAAHRLVMAAEPYGPLMQEEAAQYVSLYPQVNIDMHSATTREAIVSLLNDSVHIIIVDRQLNDEEKQVAQQASLHIVESTLAEDGVAIIVHTNNPIRNITAESARRILVNAATDWKQIAESHWSGPIELILTGRNSGMQELLQTKIFHAAKSLEPTVVMSSQRDVIQYVSEHPSAVGYVAASLLTEERKNVKLLPVLAPSPEGSEQEYVPKQQEIHESLYPFHYSLYLYNAEDKETLGLGFSAFVLSSIGQKIFQRSGLVPVSIPYRTIQLHAE